MYAPQHAAQTPDKTALIMGDSGQTLTFAEYEARCNQTAHLVREMGLAYLDQVALLMPNSLEYCVLKGASERTGLRFVCVNIHLKTDEIVYIINDSESKVVVVDQSLMEVAATLPPYCPNVERWLVVGADEVAAPFERIEPLVEPQPAEPIADERLGTATLYSSGTTGRPKGILRPLPEGRPEDTLPVYAFTNMIFRLAEGMTYLTTSPLYHSAPHSAQTGAIRLGATSVIMESFDAEEFLRLVDRYKVTRTIVVPTMLLRVMRLPKEIREKYDVSSLEAVVHGAAPCPPELKRQLIEEWGPIFYEYYGATEGNGFCMSDSQEWLERPGTVGKAVLGELVIMDENGNELPPGEEGVVWFRGATNFFYKDDPERTAESQSGDGSMSTVWDVGYLDEDGYLYLTDRKTHMIISGGVNIYPQETEDVLATHPEVVDVAVIGVPNPDFGEEVKAVVIRTESDKSDADLERELIDYCIERIAKYKCPRSVDFVTDLPRTPTGKLQKKSLRQAYLS